MDQVDATVVYRVDGLCCSSEGEVIAGALRKAPGVRGWTLNYVDSTVRVHLDQGGDADTIRTVLSETGLTVTLLPSDLPAGERPRRTSGPLVRLFVSGVAAAGSAGASILGAAELAMALSLTVVVVGGAPIALRAWGSLTQRRLDMHVLMTVAVLGALGIGEWVEAAVVVVLFALANLLEAYSLDRARRAIGQLLDLTPARATVRRDGVDVRVAIDHVRVGDVVIVKPGERLPVDGTVAGGRAAVDQSPITGEARLVAKGAGDAVFAGTFNTDGVLEIRATCRAADSAPARIRHLVEEAQATRAPVERFVDRFAARYTPAVFACAVVVAVVPPALFGGSWTGWLYRGLVLLVIACPCALVISTPVTIVSHLAAAARRGILIKGGAHLENLARVCSMVFDKTGTLTQGRPEVVRVVPLNGYSTHDVLGYAAAVEARATHPVAPAICNAARHAGVAVPQSLDPHTHPGQGLHATVDSRPVWVGTLAMARGESASLEQAAAEVHLCEARGETAVVVGSGAEPFGVLALADAPRSEASDMVGELRDVGLHHLYMLTGDNAPVAEALKQTLGLDGAFAELLPEDKVVAVRRLLDQDHRVAMVGDGINDAPALAAATVGIAVGAGASDVALETADIALVGEDLHALPRAIAIARSAMRTVRQNVAIALGLKCAVFALALAGVATLWLAILADMGASLLVIGHALGASLRS